jgi:hypothetical protein
MSFLRKALEVFEEGVGVVEEVAGEGDVFDAVVWEAAEGTPPAPL